jgi:hypothetical protein
MFSLPSRRCATTHTKSSIPEGSSKTDAHDGAFGLVEGALEPITIDAESPRCRQPPPRLHDAVGEDLVEFGEQERW